MNVFPIEPKFEIGKVGFDGKDDQNRPLDLLNRKDFGQRLTDLVDRTEQPLVIALDGPWGSGKSHFLKLWAGAHKLELGGKAEVIYFDAFEHDFLDDPLVSLIGRLADDPTLSAQSPSKLKALKKFAIPIARAAIKAGFALATFGATNYLGDALDKAAEAAGSSAADSSISATDEFWKQESGRLAAMTQFREGLAELTKKEDGTTQKIVFIIDELDRCRPDYALQMLEIIKHFFTVPNVHFVLGANLSELENSVRARYGAGINARKYLQKFVMVEMRLPEVTSGGQTWQTYFLAAKNPHNLFRFVNDALIESLTEVSRVHQVTIRDVQRMIVIVNLAQNELVGGWDKEMWICLDLIISSVLSPNDFYNFRKERVTLKRLHEALNLDVFGPKSDTGRSLSWASLLSQSDLEQEDIDFLQNKRGYTLVPITERWLKYRKEPSPVRWRDLQYKISRIFDTFTLPVP